MICADSEIEPKSADLIDEPLTDDHTLVGHRCYSKKKSDPGEVFEDVFAIVDPVGIFHPRVTISPLPAVIGEGFANHSEDIRLRESVAAVGEEYEVTTDTLDTLIQGIVDPRIGL